MVFMLGLAMLLCLGQGVASADTFADYNLAVVTPPGGVLPTGTVFGTVDVDLNVTMTSAHITFTANPGYFFVDTGAVGVDVSGAFVGPTNIVSNSVNAPTVGAGQPLPGGTQQLDGYGDFNAVINLGNSSPDGRATSVSFDVTGVFTSAATVLTSDDNGFAAAAHIGAGTIDGTLTLTGFAGTGPTPVTFQQVSPEPSTLAIAGVGGLGFVLYGLRRRVRK
jgi:hypothetical protein